MDDGFIFRNINAYTDTHLADGMGTFQNGVKTTVGKRVMGETSLIMNWDLFFFFSPCMLENFSSTKFKIRLNNPNPPRRSGGKQQLFKQWWFGDMHLSRLLGIKC